MSQEDADTIRRAYEVWNESGPEALTDQFWAEDAVYREGRGWPNAGVYRARAAALARMQSLIGPLEPNRARALVLARELGVASGLLAFHPER